MAAIKKNSEPIDWLFYENQAIINGCEYVCGIDEAGRGPLAGPVFAAAVILPYNTIIEGVNDSKKLSPKKREKLFSEIKEKALDYGIGYATEKEIDEINILNATYLAMQRAVSALSHIPDLALVDGNGAPPLQNNIKVATIIKGDACCESIAAASILAKVSRDRVMQELDSVYPEYGFAKHKGYGTAQHISALLENGPCEIHRKTFLKKILNGKNNG